MNTSDFDYDLPAEFIAQTPIEPRDESRLMVLRRDDGRLEHRPFRDLPLLLSPGDVLVMNDTRVLPARLHARKPGGGRVEVLLLRAIGPVAWEVLIGGKGVRAGTELTVEGSPRLTCVVRADLGGARRSVEFSEPIQAQLEHIGEVPLPPYIHARLEDRERYQTVFARRPGSAAAPTAGLHFTQELLQRLEQAGIELATLTLHVGLDTFAPVAESKPDEHVMHGEWCRVPPAAVDRIAATRRRGNRIVAVGTTVVRALETAAQHATDALAPFEGTTRLFIRPGFPFRVVDALVTNFHLPRSTLLMLVAAFVEVRARGRGLPTLLAAYDSAQQAGYRFYSFGDAMLIL